VLCLAILALNLPVLRDTLIKSELFRASLAILILLSLNGCASLFSSDFDLSGLKGLQKSMNGAVAVFSYPERAHRSKQTDNTNPDYQHTRCAASMHNKKRTLCAQNEQETASIRWWHTDANGTKHRLVSEINNGEQIAQITDFEVDRNWRYVAIISVEEGHPFLAIYDLSKWIATGKQATAIYALNPYPGGLYMSGWGNNQLLHALTYDQNGLRFSTDGPITAKESASGSWPRQKSRDFRFDPYRMKLVHVKVPAENLEGK